jgi:hypothetical protein
MAIQHAVVGVGFLGRNRATKRNDKPVAIATVSKQRLIKYVKSNKSYYENDGFYLVPINQIESRNTKQLRIKLHKIIDDLCNEAEKLIVV